MILRLINNPEEEEEVILPLALHCHQRIEEIVYKKNVANSAVPIAYLDSQDINSNINISILNKSDSIPENSINKVYLSNDYEVVTTSSYTTQYPDILITDVAITDNKGNQKPLFWAHNLPESTTSVKIERVTNVNSIVIENGFIIDDTKTRVYFDFTNTFNPLTKQYVLYFITATTATGTIVKGLINPTSPVRAATWEDLDSETGLLREDLVLYTKEETDSGFTYYFNQNKTFYVFVQPTSLITPLKFNQNLPEDGWFPRFTNGSFKHVDSTNLVRNYYLPEYEDISFFPTRPYFFDSSSAWKYVTKRTIYVGRNNLSINTTNMPLQIVISKSDGTVLYALTTKISANKTKYNSSVYWSTDDIASWDNSTGIIDLNIELQYDWEVQVSYYYEVKEFVYIYTNLNPLYNDLVYDHYYIYYVIPDAETRSLHHLTVRNDGIIVDCSDEQYGILIDGSYNENTFIGMTYRNSGDSYQTNDWYSLYSSETTNNYQYLILAEMFFSEKKHPLMIDVVDVSRKGDTLSPSQEEFSVYRNPKLYHSKYAATSNGLEFPQNNAIVIRLSYSLLEEYGGIWTEDALRQAFYKYLAAGKYIVFEWDETISNLQISNLVSKEISLTWNSIGSGYCYNIYRSIKKDSDFEFIISVCSDYNEVSYIDSLDEQNVYYYYVAPVKNNIEFPPSYTIGIQLR